MTVTRDEYDEHGLRWASCERCGMGWVEGSESVELILGSGEFTTAGERAHACPEPYPYETAVVMVAIAQAHDGLVVSREQRARIRLGLEAR